MGERDHGHADASTLVVIGKTGDESSRDGKEVPSLGRLRLGAIHGLSVGKVKLPIGDRRTTSATTGRRRTGNINGTGRRVYGLAIHGEPLDKVVVGKEDATFARADKGPSRTYAFMNEVTQGLRRQTEQGSSFWIGIGKAETRDSHGRNPSLDCEPACNFHPVARGIGFQI
jgi:hypothetical protein